MSEDTNITGQPEKPNVLKSLAEFLGQQNMKVFVPKIQRAYAQGRKSEENIRNQFCDELFNALENGNCLELSFVYGSKIAVNNGESIRFELLDGQQRVTTLVLLYWFLSCASGVSIPEWLKSFTYETRTTSTNFLHELSKSSLDVVSRKPSDTIRNIQWYTLAFDKDSSVEGMLNMLDAFYDRFNQSECKEKLYANLDNIRFYELDLDDFGLTEEIYIKMNARGLQLTPFENFKADIIKYLKEETNPFSTKKVKMEIAGHPTVDYYINFSQKMDNRWLDCFWRKEDKTGRDYCARFFRFFYRYFSTKCYLEVQNGLPAESFRPKATPDSEEGRMWNFLWSLSPKQNKTYFGFKYYNQILSQHPEYITNIESILDCLADKDIARVISEDLINPWDNKESRSFFDEKYQLSDAIFFAALTEYIEQTKGDFNIENFHRWMRVVRNIVENLLLRNVNEIVSIVRNLSEILKIEGATEDIYSAMASVKERNDFNRSLREELRKADIIVSRPEQNWENAFITAEKHIFFRGAIGFLLENLSENPENFIHRATLVGELFDENGIVAAMRMNHKLIRSIVRQLNRKEWFVGTTLTEKADVSNHLKVLMLDVPSVRNFISKMGDLADFVAIEEHIDNLLLEEPKMEGEDLASVGDERLEKTYRKLCNRPELYDYIDQVEKENKNKFMVVSERDGNYAIDRFRSWYDKIFLGTDRKELIDAMLQEGYQLYDTNQVLFREHYDDYFGYRIWIDKNIDEDSRMSIEFHQNGTARIVIHKNLDGVQSLFPESYSHDYYEDWLTICEIPAEKMDNLQNLKDKATQIESIIRNKEKC